MEFEFRLPSKKVQYGYVNVTGTQDELARLDYEKLGGDYLESVVSFWSGELDRYDEIQDGTVRQEIRHPKTGAPTPVVDVPLPGDEDATSAAADLITEKLGATKISEEVYDEPVEDSPKPWATSSFDFGS